MFSVGLFRAGLIINWTGLHCWKSIWYIRKLNDWYWL